MNVFKVTEKNIGEVLAVTFRDHTTGRGIEVFTVYGRLSAVHRDYIVVDTLVYVDDTPIEDRDPDNIEQYSLVKSTITDIEFLRRI